ncbi:MAG: prenyltransferase/squalene oxidase repeat-containing protein, partial [Planctomycetota bacterium]
HEQEVEKPVLVHEEAEVSDHFETDNDMDTQTARGHEDAISDIPLGGTGVTGSMGVGGGGMAGCFGYRGGGGRKRAIARFGGSKATESAVEAALRWLARHQESDGRWAGEKWESKRDKRSSMAMTGLATLAFLGAGYTHKTGKFRDNVNRAVNWMVSQQHENGGLLGKKGYRYNHYDGYCHSMGAMALVEAYGMSKDPILKEPAQKTVDYTVKVHQVPYGGWRYQPRKSEDISHTGWFIMQLKSARVAGLQVDGAAFQGGMNFTLSLLGKDTGKSVYEKSQIGSANYGGGLGLQRAARRTAISQVCRLFMGTPRDDELLIKGNKWVLACPPEWEKRDFYGLYYATLAMFQIGGDAWKEWNKPMKKMLVDNQRKGGPLDGSVNDVDGSWDADKGCWDCGRTFSTALGALSLEVYYRYLPMYSK